MFSISVEREYSDVLEILQAQYPGEIYITDNVKLASESRDVVEVIVALTPTIALLVPILHMIFEHVKNKRKSETESKKIEDENVKVKCVKVKLSNGDIDVEVKSCGGGETADEIMALAVSAYDELQGKRDD